MGRAENLEKLNKELQKDIKEECQVICIMSRIRKVLEQHENILGDKYSLLKFYCHWVLHPRLNSISYAKEVLKKIAEAHKDQEISGAELYFVNFGMLRGEINSFFEEFDLQTDLSKNAELWKSFRKILLDILIDCPLEPRTGPVERFAFKKSKLGSDDIDWEIKFFDDDINYSGSLTEFYAKDILKEEK